MTGNPIELLAGRYGPYVTDGQTNASLPRGMTPEEVTFDAALVLLKARADSAPSRPARKTAAPKRAAAPKAAAKKAAKKTTRKKAAKKALHRKRPRLQCPHPRTPQPPATMSPSTLTGREISKPLGARLQRPACKGPPARRLPPQTRGRTR